MDILQLEFCNKLTLRKTKKGVVDQWNMLTTEEEIHCTSLLLSVVLTNKL